MRKHLLKAIRNDTSVIFEGIRDERLPFSVVGKVST